MKKTYSLVLYATTLQYSIILVAQQGLHLHLMDDVTTYSQHICQKKNDEDLLGLEAPYLSVIETLMYLTNYTHLILYLL